MNVASGGLAVAGDALEVAGEELEVAGGDLEVAGDDLEDADLVDHVHDLHHLGALRAGLESADRVALRDQYAGAEAVHGERAGLPASQ